MSGAPPLKMPGAAGARLGAIPAGTPMRTELPEIYEAQPGDAMPSICIVGDSGTGKTHQLGLLIRHLREVHKKAALVLSVESKHQGLTPFGPKILPIGAPIAANGVLRMPTATERYRRLLQFRDDLRAGKFREHNGMPIGAILADGLTEIGNVVKAHRLDNMPVASSTGQTNTFRVWGEIGNDLLDFFAALKEAASDVGKAMGMEPITIVTTAVETLDGGKFKPLLPGNMAPDNYAQQFEVVLRLAVESAGMNTTAMQFVAHTINGEVMLPQTGRWIAKAPSGIFDAKIVNPNLGEIFDKLIAYYRGGDAAQPSASSPTIK